MSVTGIDDDDDKWLLGVKSKGQKGLNDALFAACLLGNLERVEVLLGAGANAAAEKSDALRLAISAGAADVAAALLRAGARVNDQSFLGMAIERRKPQVAEILIAKGADPHARHQGIDAFGWAAEAGPATIGELLHKPYLAKFPELSPRDGAATNAESLAKARKRDGKRFKI